MPQIRYAMIVPSAVVAWLTTYFVTAAAGDSGGIDPGTVGLISAVLSFISAITVGLITARQSRKSKKEEPQDLSTTQAILEALRDAEAERAQAIYERDQAKATIEEQVELVKHLYQELEEDRDPPQQRRRRKPPTDAG